MVKFISLFFIVYGLLEFSCFSMDEVGLETQKSLQRVYRICDYSPEDAIKESTHNIVVLDSGFDTWHQDLKEVFVDPYNPHARSTEVNQIICGRAVLNIHGTAVSGIIHDITPMAKIIPVIYGSSVEDRLGSLDYALNKAGGDIINISQSLSKEGYTAAPIAPNFKDLLIKSFSQEKVIVIAAGNAHCPMNDLPLTKDLKELAELSNDKFIIVGGTTPNAEGKEEIWVDGSQLNAGQEDQPYLPIVTLGSIYPGKEAAYQKVYVSAPAGHYTSFGLCADYYYNSTERKYFGMTSSAAPVVTSFVERSWTHSAKSKAEDIGHAIYNGTNQSFRWYTAEANGEGLVNYKGSLSLLQTEKYKSYKNIEN